MILYQLLIFVLTSLLYIHAREISSPPRIVKQPPTDELNFHVATDKDENDEPFYIECEATGEPSPKYHWIKNGKKFDWQTYDNRISQLTGRGTLIFSKPTNDDIGHYQCIAENEWGVATSNSVFIRRAQLNSFKNSPPLISSGKEGEPYKLSCEPPNGWPKPNVDWIIQNEGGGFKSIDNSRITLDPEGNLWFSYLTLNDASKGFMYACTASSATRLEYKLGNGVVLNVLESDGANQHPPVPQYVTRKNKVALRGKSVELFCIYGGKPLPQTLWLKNGKRIDFGDRISQRNYGKSLLIKLVDFDDQGAYTCEVSNGVGEAKLYSINLEVLAVPYFTEEPEFITAAEDETVEFRCAAAGVPEPEIQWIYNGKPISHAPPNSRRKVGPNNIVIERLTKKDTGNYGCNATNSLGYVYKDVYINVQAFPPEITEASTSLEAVDGKDINIPCKVYGVPKPAVKWIRNGNALTGDKYKVLNSGDLHIPNVQFEDGGEYICYAENKFGNVNVSCSLIVREHTEVTVGAEYTEVAAGTQATVGCKVKHDNNLDWNIIWLFNGYPIELNEEPRFVLTPDYSLTISKTNELDSGTYTCRARTSLDEAEALASLIVQDVPNPPEIKQIECNKMDATVKWLPMGDNRAPIHRYSIQYSTSFTPNTWEDMSNNIPPTDMSYNVHMSPWANYTFRVIATNKIGPSEPSRHSSICSTNAEVPQKNPDNVEGKGDRPDNLVISWTPMPQIEHNAPGFHYKVYWKQDIPGEPYFTREILDWQQSQIVVENVPSFTQYRIKVVAINYLGEANVLAREVIGYSGEDHVPNAPEITQIECNKMDATVKWLPMGDNRAPIHRYSIQYSTSFTPNTWEDMSNNIPPTDMSYNVYMSPWANYTFRVIATNKIGPSEPSRHSSICSTNAEVPQKNPDDVQGKGDRPDNLVISWSPMPQIEHNAPGFHYKVYWKQDIPGEPYFTREILDWQQSQIVVENVPSFTQYRIKVVAINDLGEANVLAREVIGYSGEDQPLLAPENFTLIQILSPTAALLNWNPVPAHSVRGHFKGYKIKTWTENEVGYRELQVRADATAALVNNLVPYSKNFVQIYVYNDKYNGPPSNALTIDMPEGAPGPISSLDAYQLGASAFYLDWKKPERSNGVLTGYRIYYSVINGPNVGEMFEREQNVTDPDQLQAKVAGLQPNTKYRLYVVAATSVGVSPKYMIERTTKAVEPAVRPSIPNFSMQRIPTTNGSATIRVIWKPVISGNPGSYFFVKYKKKGESDYLETKPEFQFEYFDVTALEPEQTYEFILVDCNGDTYKTPSEAQEINL